MISCVCLTIPGRTEFLKRAIECFRRQTYKERELVIVADDCASDNERLVRDMPGQARVFCTGRVTVGTKRNVGCEHARGDVIALWDDDDYSAPHRLEEQAAVLAASGKAVTANYRLYMNDSDPRLENNHPGQMWWLTWPGWIDTSLMFTKAWWSAHHFTDKMMGQDGDFMHEANRLGQFHLNTGGERWMFATNHAGNTCDRREQYTAANALKNFVWTEK